MKYLIPFFKKYMKESLLAPLFKMIEALCDLFVPLVVVQIIDIGIAGGDKKFIAGHFAIIVLMALLGLLSSFTAQYFAAKAAVGTSAGLRHSLFKHIETLSFTELDTLGTSTLITRLTADINSVQNGINMFLRLFLRSPFIVFGAMIMAFSIDRTAGLVFAAVIPVLFIIVFGIMFITKPRYKKCQDSVDAVTASVRENLDGVRVIRAFGREESETEQFDGENSLLNRLQLVAGRLSALMNPLCYAAVNGAIILILMVGAKKVSGGVLLSGNVVALINYLSQILVELVKLANLIVLLSRAAVSCGRIGAVLDTKSSMQFGNITEGAGECALEFENVSFKYAGAGDESLSDISFSLNRGGVLGVIGGTGSGKSTLSGLAARFYDATRGNVSFMGNNIKDWDKNALRARVSVVMQKSQLFAGTVRSNLMYGNPNTSEDDMWQALHAAQAEDFVREKPGMLDTKVEQGGRNFSGGQRQRLSVARALVSKPQLLILDDSSSALDYKTDANMRKAICNLPYKPATIIISQRTAAIEHADKILVLEDGHAAGTGTHEKLLETCPVYREIYNSASGGESRE